MGSGVGAGVGSGVGSSVGLGVGSKVGPGVGWGDGSGVPDSWVGGGATGLASPLALAENLCIETNNKVS